MLHTVKWHCLDISKLVSLYSGLAGSLNETWAISHEHRVRRLGHKRTERDTKLRGPKFEFEAKLSPANHSILHGANKWSREHFFKFVLARFPWLIMCNNVSAMGAPSINAEHSISSRDFPKNVSSGPANHIGSLVLTTVRDSMNAVMISRSL